MKINIMNNKLTEKYARSLNSAAYLRITDTLQDFTSSIIIPLLPVKA